VGYSGGTKASPTYRSLGDHTETVQLDYDPSQISYEQLLEVFWHSHDPTARQWSTQYKAAVFYHSEEQKKLALDTRDAAAKRLGKEIHTEILPAAKFHMAEDYHQKYYLRSRADFMKLFEGLSVGAQELVSSTAAARINGLIAGHITVKELQSELAGGNLPPGAAAQLKHILGRIRQ
jgi:peptide-methionine (S)-S-oxide reductase